MAGVREISGLVSYCGFYCGECPKYKNKECSGCRGDTPGCAVGYKACRVRPCCVGNGYNTCAGCEKYNSVRDCSLYNPFLIRFGQLITGTRRRKGIEMISEKGEAEFVRFMSEKRWVTFKIRGAKN